MSRPFLVAAMIIWPIAMVCYFIRARMKKKSQGFGFLEWVKNPSLRRGMSGVFEARDKMRSDAMRQSPSELVEMLAAPLYYEPARYAICEKGESAVAYLIAALDDPRYDRAYENADDHFLNPDSPLLAVLWCLMQTEPTEDALDPLTQLLSNENKEVRQKSMLVIGIISTEACIPMLTKALTGDNEDLQGYAVSGLARSADKDRLAAPFKDTIFELLKPLAWAGIFNTSESAATVMLSLDCDRALAFMASPTELRPDRKGLKDVLTAFIRAKVVLPESHLLDLTTELHQLPLEYPTTYALSAALDLLAFYDSKQTLDAIRAQLSSSESMVKEHAAMALAKRNGIDDPFTFAFAHLDAVGWAGLTTPQTNLLAVRMLTDQVNNGGFFQYFTNPGGERWQTARDGLVAMESQIDLAIYDRALALFGTSGPSEDHDELIEQVATIARRDEEAFSQFESSFFDDAGSRETQMLIYAMKHADEFH